MRLSPARVEQTLHQFEAQVIPDDHPAMPRIKELWGDHTYFLDVNGLNIVEPFLDVNGLNIVEPIDIRESDVEAGAVISLANWTDETATSLAAHEPKATEVVVEFDAEDDAERRA